MNWMHNPFDVMLFANDDRGQGPGFLAERCSCDLILARALHGLDVEAERVASFESARSMETCIAVETIHAGACIVSDFVLVIFVFAELADCLEPLLGDHLKALCDLEYLGVAEANLWCPNCAMDMHPVVASSSLERLSRKHRAVMHQLLAAIFGAHTISELLLQALLLAFAISLLLVRDLRWLHKVDLCLFGQA